MLGRRIMQGHIEDASAVPQAPPRTVREEAGLGVERRRSVRESYRRLYRWIALTDALSISLALLLAYEIRFEGRMPEGQAAVLWLGAPLALLAVYGLFHLYDAYRYSAAEEFWSLG
jgi:hypothetical protein